MNGWPLDRFSSTAGLKRLAPANLLVHPRHRPKQKWPTLSKALEAFLQLGF